MMRILTKPTARHDPKMVYAVSADRAAGMTVEEIATKHGLPALTIKTLLRPTGQPGGLCTPYELAGADPPRNAAAQVYWLGYIAAAGRVFNHGSSRTLLLAIHAKDEGHIQTLVADLVSGHPSVEFADSNLDGRQVYIRDRDLVEALATWGICDSPGRGSISLELVPRRLLPDFVRGFLEGARVDPPVRRAGARASSPRGHRPLTLTGHPALLATLSQMLSAICGIGQSAGIPWGSEGLTRITLPPQDALRVMHMAYARPVRSTPRAAALVARFGPRPDQRYSDA